ncbi:Protein ORANGE-LIKE, chloroplastic [Linum grandiflorum]
MKAERRFQIRSPVDLRRPRRRAHQNPCHGNPLPPATARKWTVESWKTKKAFQLSEYPNVDDLRDVLKTIEEFPPLVLAGKARSPEDNLGEADVGNAFFAVRWALFSCSIDVSSLQQRIRSGIKSINGEEEDEMPEIQSTIPFIPHPTPKMLKQLYLTSFSFISRIIGGLIAPIVDPIVASFSGGVVGVISALILIEVEANNVEHQEKKRCRVFCWISMLSLLLLLGVG